MRQGNMYLAAPLGMRAVTSGVPETAELINDLDTGGWLQSVRRLAQDNNSPARARHVMKRFQDALFALTDAQVTAIAVQNAIEILGEIVGWLSTSPDARVAIRPPPLLRRAWVRRADDGTAEYRAAAALASLGWIPGALRSEPAQSDARNDSVPAEVTSARQPMAPLAAHVAPVAPATVPRRFREWDQGGNRALYLWGSGGLAANLVDVLEQRARVSSASESFAAAAPARADVVARFLSDSFDENRCARLLRGLVWARPASLPRVPTDTEPPRPPFAYAALKLLFAPGHVVDDFSRRSNEEDGRRIPLPSGLLARLRAGDVDEAVRQALDRARASGLASPFAHGSARRTTGFGAGMDGRRLAAAMLIPIHDHQLKALLDRAYPTEKENEDVA